jgi:Na+-translocating ferredoxin:NAD+ oxidoreductase RNF subunit RnfB
MAEFLELYKLDIIKTVIGFVSILLLGGGIGVDLSLAFEKLKVEKNRKLEELEELLPGLNCGSCGYPNCSAYGEALVKEEDTDITRCKPGGPEILPLMADILGVEAEEAGERMVAAIHCRGGNAEAADIFEYHGHEDCHAASLRFGGHKACKYGCLGQGSCIGVCPVDAISLAGNGLIKIDRNLCIGCEKCVEQCPTGVLKMIPFSADHIVACNSQDKGKDTRKNCKVGCIACKICVNKFPGAGFQMNGDCSVVQYGKGDETERRKAAEKCPTHCIIQAE